jgi:uncharacterized membrane protein
MSAKPNLDSMSMPAGVVSRAQEVRLPGEIRIHLCAHCSLSPGAARWFFLSVASAPLLIAAFCVAHGWWPVLPFAGMELGLLALVLRHSMRRGRQQECITITDDHVTINAQLGAIPATTRFSRHWTRVKLRVPPTLHPRRLCFESQGRVCEVGRFLTEDERAVLAARLHQLVGGMSDSPPL